MAKVPLREQGHDEVIRLLDDSEVAASSRIGLVECHAAVRRSAFDGSFEPDDLDAAFWNLAQAWNGIVILEADRTVCTRAIELLSTLQLRGADAIHLASALEFAGDAPKEVAFVTWDKRLAEAAASVRFNVFPPPA